MSRRNLKVLIVLLTLVASCHGYKDNPALCRSSSECAAGQMCSLESNLCVPVHAQDGGAGLDGGGQGGKGGQIGGDAGGEAGKIGCTGDDDCRGTSMGSLCDKASGRCVACLADSQCAGDTPLCMAGACVSCGGGPADGCAKKDQLAPACASSGACVACVADGDCKQAAAPICRANTCNACRADTECARARGGDPGVCLAHLDGRCASAEEVVYTQEDQADANTCVNSGAAAGSLSKPYCGIDDAVAAAVAGGKAAVVFRGPRGQLRMRFNRPNQTLLVVGQQGAFLAPSVTGSGVEVTAGKLWLRGVTVRGSETIGVRATGAGTELHLQGVTITGNAGGLLIDGAAFSVENTIVAKNLLGQSGEGGVVIRNPPAAGPKRLRHVTVVENPLGITCSSPVDATGVIAAGNTTQPDITAACSITSCCTGALSLSPTWRLSSASSMCFHKVAADMSLPFDIDGTLRPQGTSGDCGAHEFLQP